MLDLKDFFHLPEVDVLLAQIVNDQRGITVVAGLGPRSAQSGLAGTNDGPIAQSGRSTITAILMRHMLDRVALDRKVRALIVGPDRSALRVANHQRKQIEFISAPIDHIDGFSIGLQQAMLRAPDLLVLDRLNTVTAQAAFHAAAAGRRILTQIDTALVGGEVLQELVGLGCSPSQMSLVAWVIAVQRVAVLCTHCKQPHRPLAALVETMIERHTIDGGATFYTAAGCRHCHGTGYLGELTAFDVYRVHGGMTSFSELVSTPSLLPLEGYLARLAEQGYVPLEDAARVGATALRKVQQLLTARESTLDETSRALQRKLAEVEAANKVLAQRTEALIALQDISQRLSGSMRLAEIAERVVHYARELCGADRAILYLVEPPDTGQVLAVSGWEEAQVRPLDRLPASMLERGEPESVVGVPPAISLPPEQIRALQAGLRVPLVVEDTLVGLLIVNSLHRTRFAPGSVALLKMFGEQVAVSIQRARLMEALHDKVKQLEAAQAELIKKERLERELELARDLQRRLLPETFPSIAGVRFAAAYRPAREVGGDLYDVIDLGDGRLGVLIADVSDKGLPAAFYMGVARALIGSEARRSDSPRQVLTAVNRMLAEVAHAQMFVTVFYAILEVEARRLVYCRAGHDRPLWLRSDGYDVLLGAPGMLLGMLDGDELDLAEAEIFLSPGETLILYTDGMTDALDPNGAEFGVEHWAKRARENAALPPDQLCAVLFDEVVAFQSSAAQMDDMTLLVMRISDF
ncbi:MAG TPA: SpoIIE family protein phosphatase [Anaerolineae bacterium]|nr:SpoIIE family protein phosphatase [Anaerolineae bacterium]